MKFKEMDSGCKIDEKKPAYYSFKSTVVLGFKSSPVILNETTYSTEFKNKFKILCDIAMHT